MLTCSSCGHENRDGAKFCEDCAEPLAVAERSSEVRKTVTIVFCDVVGSTAMGEALDPESLRRVMQRYFEAMRAAIERHGGTVEKFIGDAVMAVFGVPQVHEDDALRAVRAAAEMCDGLAKLNEDLDRDRDHGTRLACRIGVNTGEVVAGAGDQTIVTGDAVNVAARLEQAAAPGEVLLGEETYRLVHDAVVAEPVDALDLKGKTDPVPAHRLLEVTPGAAGFARHLDVPIVGRERELSLLRDAFERTMSDHACQLFTILGIGGVGKSRLLAAFVDELGDRARVLRGWCLPYGEGITFWPLAEALIDAADLNEANTPKAARAKLAALMREDDRAETIAERVGQAIGIPGSETVPEETLWAIRVLLEQLAAERPLVFMIDDLQWAEPKFLELVEHVSDLARDAPILLACMARPELLDDHPGWAGGKLNATSILLEPLGPEECGTLVANLLADNTVDEAVRTRIAEAAEGHPLYAEEITGLLVDEGRLVLKDGRWKAMGDLSDVPVPPTISALLAARLDKLPLPERRVIDIASVMRQVFYSGAVRELADDHPEGVEAGLTALVRKQFVRPERSDLRGTEALGFRHLLIRDAAYDAIPKALRADLHERFADWLDEAAGTLVEQDEILGYHLEQAYLYKEQLGPIDSEGLKLAQKAFVRLANAGGRAFRRGDMPATVNLLDRALALLPIDDGERGELLLDLGVALFETGELGRADDALTKAIAGGTARDDSRIQSNAVVLRSHWRMYSDTKGTNPGDARADAEQSIAVFEKLKDDLGLARAWALLFDVHWWSGEVAKGAAAAEHAADHAHRAGSPQEEVWALGSLALALLWGPTPVLEGAKRCLELMDQRQGDRTAEAVLLGFLAGHEAMLGRFERARRHVLEAGAITRDLGLKWWEGVNGLLSAHVELFGGDAQAAEERLRAASELFTDIGDEWLLSGAAVDLTRVLNAQSRYEEAFQLTETLEDPGSFELEWRIKRLDARATCLSRLGRTEEAVVISHEALTLVEKTDFLNLRGDVLMGVAQVLSMAQRVDEAAPLVSRALKAYERKGNVVSARIARTTREEIAR